MDVGQRDDEMDDFLQSRGWWSRRVHADQHRYNASFDSWGWGGAAPGGINFRPVGRERYEASWVRSSSGEPVIEVHETRASMIVRVGTLGTLEDYLSD